MLSREFFTLIFQSEIDFTELIHYCVNNQKFDNHRLDQKFISTL